MSKHWTTTLRADLERAGWTVRCKKHHVGRCPCGRHTMTWARTSSDRRAEQNARGVLRRILADCGAPPCSDVLRRLTGDY